jgi:hypothetical protein
MEQHASNVRQLKHGFSDCDTMRQRTHNTLVTVSGPKSILELFLERFGPFCATDCGVVFHLDFMSPYF